MDEAHPCAKFNKSPTLPLPCTPSAFLSAYWSVCPLLLHSSSPFSNGNKTEPCWNSSARSELSSQKRNYGWSCRVFKVWPSRHQKFSLWPNHFGHSLGSLPQYTTGLWLLLLCIMEQNPVSVPSLHTPSPHSLLHNH